MCIEGIFRIALVRGAHVMPTHSVVLAHSEPLRFRPPSSCHSSSPDLIVSNSIMAHSARSPVHIARATHARRSNSSYNSTPSPLGTSGAAHSLVEPPMKHLSIALDELSRCGIELYVSSRQALSRTGPALGELQRGELPSYGCHVRLLARSNLCLRTANGFSGDRLHLSPPIAVRQHLA
ncbi:hypothetical protein CERSUDRAFT_119581 [Gelatoporia subvermispora B]|uniref:Uncharacterized protein n=1 Tax=Ceriporiopsis subvermispora (strain B) TaxID=914234 RepID=M2Q4J2_CERS8|nr:hypothetical protein CERSUDRAFT_119581 [Gelatoporia subvermispora B]